jgi:hypothetical protein
MLVVDPRGGLTPSQMVEGRLLTLLGCVPAGRLRKDVVRYQEPSRAEANSAAVAMQWDEPGPSEIADMDHRPAGAPQEARPRGGNYPA